MCSVTANQLNQVHCKSSKEHFLPFSVTLWKMEKLKWKGLFETLQICREGLGGVDITSAVTYFVLKLSHPFS